jgi:hypothetical protein
MQLNAKRALAAALVTIAAAGNACAVTLIVAESPAQAALFDGARPLAHGPGDAAAMPRHVGFPADPFQPAPPAVQAAAQANEMAEEPSPYEMLLLGAGVMMLVGRSAKKSAPWAPSTVE